MNQQVHQKLFIFLLYILTQKKLLTRKQNSRNQRESDKIRCYDKNQVFLAVHGIMTDKRGNFLNCRLMTVICTGTYEPVNPFSFSHLPYQQHGAELFNSKRRIDDW